MRTAINHCVSMAVVLSFLLPRIVPVAYGAEWATYMDPKAQIQFLSIGTPEARNFDGPDATKTIWHFGYLDDGTNGYVDATRLKSGTFADLDVVRDVAGLRAGLEQTGKTKVEEQRTLTVAGTRAVEFRTTSVTSKGEPWYGVVRMFVLGNTLYALGITAPTRARLEDKQVQAYLDSFKRLP